MSGACVEYEKKEREEMSDNTRQHVAMWSCSITWREKKGEARSDEGAAAWTWSKARLNIAVGCEVTR